MKRITLILLLSLPLITVAQIYKTTDENGNVVFTDTPQATGNPAEKVELGTTNIAAPPPVIDRPPEPEPEPEPEATDYTVSIKTPANETTIPMGPGNFLLSASVKPALNDKESLQLHVDGIPWGEPQSASSWALTNVFRGAHDLTVSVLDSKGVPLVTSSAVRVYVLRPSIHNINRR